MMVQGDKAHFFAPFVAEILLAFVLQCPRGIILKPYDSLVSLD